MISNIKSNILKENTTNKYIKQNYKNNKWYIILSFIFLFFVLTVIFKIFYGNNDNLLVTKNKDHVAIVEIDGVISEKSKTNAKGIIEDLDKAFYSNLTKALIIKINSPGGSPVQCNIIHNHIKYLRNKNKNKPIISVVEDICTSGAYLIAVSTEKIYSDPSSIIGSIGVTMNSFGFVDLIKFLGIERRFYKAGKHKAIMDPFLTINDEEDKIIKDNINKIHKIFINIVKDNRAGKLKTDSDDIFSGKFWIGEDAVKLGLIDGFYDIYSLSLNIFHTKHLIDYTGSKNMFKNFEKILID